MFEIHKMSRFVSFSEITKIDEFGEFSGVGEFCEFVNSVNL